MMRGMGGSRRKVDEERLVWGRRLLLADPTDRLVSHGFGKVPVRVVVRHFDGRCVLEERRMPLAGLSTLETVKVIKALAGRPAIVRAACAQFVVRRVMPFAEGGGSVLIGLENLRDTRGFFRPLAVVAGKTGGQFGDAACMYRVVVAARQQGCPCRRAEGRRVEAIVAQARLGQPL